MPIQLDDIASITNATQRAVTPKFFNSALTGSGKAAGLLNERVRPGRYMTGSNKYTLSINSVNTKTKSSGNNVTTHTIPLHPLTHYSLNENKDRGLTLPVPARDDMFHVTENRTKVPMEVHVHLTPQGMVLYEDGNGDKITRELNIAYRMEVFVLNPGSTAENVALRPNPPYQNGEEFVMIEWSYAPLDDIEELIRDASMNVSGSGSGVFVDVDELATWMNEYDVHERICRLADVWAGDEVGEMIGEHITQLFAQGKPDQNKLNYLAKQLRFLETYKVSLDAYRHIYHTINTVCPPEIAQILSKQNLNLLMSHSMEDLSALKPQLPKPPVNQQAVSALPQHLSIQQRNAVISDDPLTLVTAGAGTGKSSTIENRIEYLVGCGVSPSDITVLSFTNAAADNITDRMAKRLNGAGGNVTSMTIARMIHEIYSLNFSTHELSSIDTILNSLDIFYPSDDLAHAFRRHLMDVDKKQPGAHTALNAFIEKYYDQVIEVLNTLRQTCLELEITIAYQQIDHMAEPPHIKSEYLIIDEVQDNSIFEFIYTLKYVAKHRENLYIVGDASQTLYEFRASNPRALNTLERSGVFSTFQLTTNYRSNQEILDFANVHLADIEANQTAQLRLQANSLIMPTVDTFSQKVNLRYMYGQRLSEFEENYPAYIKNVLGEYISDCLARGEQVAFLMHTRRMVKTTEETLGQLFPGEHVANLTSDKVYSTTVFSQFIKLFWNDVLQVPDVAAASLAVSKGIMDNLDKLTKNADKSKAAVQRMVSDWWLSNSSSINGWVNLVRANNMSRQDFFDNLRQNLLDYEIRHNAIKKSLMNQKNRERKERNLQAQARLVVSTVHGAKGLEFDNVVVIHKYDSQMPEADKRMYYVAFTRAMKTEFILSYGTIKKPRIESDYDLILEALSKREQLEKLRAQGVNVDTMSDDDVAAALAAMEDDSATGDPGDEQDQAQQTSDDDEADQAPAPATSGDQGSGGDVDQDDSAFTAAT